MFDKELLALLGKDKRYVVYIVICDLLTTISSLVVTFSLCMIVDRLIGTGSGYGKPFAAAVLAVAVRFILALANGHFSAQLGSGAREMLRRRIYQKVAALGVRETDELSLASLTQVGVEGVEQLDLYYSNYIPQFFYSVISPFILFALLMMICVPSAVILLVCVPLIPMSIIAVSRYAKKIFAKYWGQYTKMGDAFLDNISGMKELKIFAADDLYHDRMNSEAEEFRKITMKVLTMQLASTTIMDLVAYGGAGLGIAIAAANRMQINPLFNMSRPALLLFIVLTAVDFFLPLRALGSAFHVSMNGATAGRKILALLKTPEPVWGNEPVSGYDVEARDISFGYTKERKILDHVGLKACPGSLTAIVGLSGSGKSTLIRLFSGIRSADDGQILIGGKPIGTLSRDDYFRHCSIISYDTYLFNDTIRENFRLADEHISDEAIMSCLKKVDLDTFVLAEGGPDMVLKEGAANLSGGQRQRLALAVGLAADREIYLFDEVTSNIDAVSEAVILKNIYELARTKTVIMVSHRLKNFVQAGQIYVLEGGKIAQQGTHSELMASDGLYARMFKRQQELEDGGRRCL